MRIKAAMVMLCLALTSVGSADAQDVAKGRQLTPPFYVFNPDLAHDLVTQDVGAIGFQPFVDNLGWNLFVALNWPVPSPIGPRGVPDRQNIIGGLLTSGEGGTRSMAVGPVVWETFKDSNDIYLDPPVRPTPFDTPESVPPACKQLAAENPAAARRTLTMTSKFGEILRGNKEADGNRLVDQNGFDVWYEVKLNRTYYDYVVANGFYDSRRQQGKTIAFPASSNTTAPTGTIKVKAAWKVMGLLGSRQPDDLAKFYKTDALVLDPATGICRKELLGLVGLHIVMKTAQLPQWLWATFEHVDNAPDQTTGPVPRQKYNFFATDCAGCPLNTPPSKQYPQAPTQVVRVVPVNNVAATDNTKFKDALLTLRPDNVWQNYMLVDAQWGASATPIGVPNQPKFLANTTLETYLQLPQQPNGCINCHGMYAAKTDLDFQLQNAYPRQPNRLADMLRLPGVAARR